MDLNVFYTAMAGATATLLGLLFVAVQPHIELLFGDPQGRWKALAISTFNLYALILVMALFAFIPTFRPASLIVGPILGTWRQLRTWLPVWRQATKGRYERLRETFWLLVAPVLVFAALIYSAAQLIGGTGGAPTEAGIASCFIILLAIVLRNSWRLLVEIPSEAQRKEN